MLLLQFWFPSLTRYFDAHKAERQQSISKAEDHIESFRSLPGQIMTLDGDLEEKRNRATKMANEIGAAQYDKKVQEKTTTIQNLDSERDSLNAEFRALSTQADSRAKLEYLKTEVKTKSGEIKAM